MISWVHSAAGCHTENMDLHSSNNSATTPGCLYRTKEPMTPKVQFVSTCPRTWTGWKRCSSPLYGWSCMNTSTSYTTWRWSVVKRVNAHLNYDLFPKLEEELGHHFWRVTVWLSLLWTRLQVQDSEFYWKESERSTTAGFNVSEATLTPPSSVISPHTLHLISLWLLLSSSQERDLNHDRVQQNRTITVRWSCCTDTVLYASVSHWGLI